MKTTTTITIDAKLKRLAMPIIQNKMYTTLSAIVNEQLRKIVEKYKKK